MSPSCASIPVGWGSRRRDRGFESGLLQQRVCEPSPETGTFDRSTAILVHLGAPEMVRLRDLWN
jgi:hypothetical protein